jgi:hypothetical protein
VTNNDAAFSSAEGSSYERIFLAQGRYLTTANPDTFTKTYVGPGKIYYPSGTADHQAFQNAAWYQTNVTDSFDPKSEYGFAEDTKFGNPSYHTIMPGTRRNFDRQQQTPTNPNGFSTYFWAPAVPRFSYFFSKSGWSGLSGVLAAQASAGATTAQIAAGTTGWQIGDVVGFTPGASQDGIPTDTVTVTGVTPSAITFSPALANTYATNDVVSHGYRTMNVHTMVVGEHTGGGDCYAFLARMVAAYQVLPSQVGIPANNSGFTNAATIGIIGGDMTLEANYNYATGWECQYIDTGFDVSVAGSVNSYTRTNNTAAWGCFWVHDYAKMDAPNAGNNLKPVDGVWVAAMYSRTGLDLTRSVCSLAAIAIPQGQKIALNASVEAPGATNGNGLVATTDGGVYLWSSADAAGLYAQLVNGSSAVTVRPESVQINGPTEITSLLVDASATIAGDLTVSGTLSAATFSPNSISTGSIAASSTITAASNITATAGTVTGKYLMTKQESGAGQHILYFGDQSNGASYIIVDTSTAQAALYVKGVQKQLWS